jgi:hypothetical protein
MGVYSISLPIVLTTTEQVMYMGVSMFRSN